MKLLLSGSGGFIGEAVFSHFAEKGDEVVRLKRKSPDIFDWDLSKCDFDAVIHLAGEPIFTRWTKEKKRRILLSRSIGTTNLAVLLLNWIALTDLVLALVRGNGPRNALEFAACLAKKTSKLAFSVSNLST